MDNMDYFFSMVQRHSAEIRFFAIVGSLIILTISQFFLYCVIMYGHWVAQQPRQLDILGKALWFNQFMVMIGIGALTVTKVSLKSQLGDFTVDPGGDNQPTTSTTSDLRKG